MKELINKNKKYFVFTLCLIISLIYFAVMKNTINSVFDTTYETAMVVYIMVLVIDIFLLSILLYYIYYFISNRKKYKPYLKHFLIYFGIMLVLLFLFWPGIYKSDEYYVIKTIYHLMINYRQHYMTSLFYLISLFFIPTIGGITFVQILIISIIVGYILGSVEINLKNKKLIYLMYVPLLVFPVIDNNLFTLRSSLTSYLFLLIVFELIFYIKDNSNKRLIISALIAIVIGNWKSEFIYIPVLLFVYVLIFYGKKIGYKNLLIESLILAFVFVFLKLPQKYDTNYNFTAVLNPLAIMVSENDNIKNTISEKDIENLEKLVSFDILKKEPSYIGTPVYWTGELNYNLTKKEKFNFYVSYVKLVCNNFGLFMKARFKTYMLTNFATGKTINHNGEVDPARQWTLVWNGSTFYNTNYKFTSNPFGQDFKHKLIAILQFRSYDDYSASILNPVFYNVTPSLILCLILIILFLIKKKFKEAFIQFIAFVQVPLVFLTAPANFWMYYVCAYIIMNVCFVYYTVLYFDKKNTLKKLEKAIKFFAVSGIGWVIDFVLYTCLVYLFNSYVLVSNIISSLVSVTFVYFISTRKIFNNKCNLKLKYFIYILYQLVMILFSSFMINKISLLYGDILCAELLAKITFTPVTMICNYLFMKMLIERFNLKKI